jgi:hypothetical protein
MFGRILSIGTPAALAALLFVAGSGVAQAARCPLGEIYRPSRGVCVTKEKAIQAGIYRGSSQTQASAPREAAPAVEAADADTTSVRKARPQAIAAIEREAPVLRRRADEALAFTRQPGAAPAPVGTPIQPKTVQIVPIVLSRPQPSPFGSLVALEPLP